MKWLKHHIWAVVRLIKIYSSNPVVKWICWLLLDIVLHFQGGSVVRPAQRQKSVITTADKKNPTSPVHRRTRRLWPRLLHKLLSFLCLFATALHTPLPLKWHLEFIRIWNRSLCARRSTKKNCGRACTWARACATREQVCTSRSPICLCFCSFEVIIPGAADSKSSSPLGLVKTGGLSWTGSSWNEVYGLRKGGKGRDSAFSYAAFSPTGSWQGPRNSITLLPERHVYNHFLTSDFRETQ